MWNSFSTSLTLELLRARFETNEVAKKELAEKISTKSMPTFLSNITKLLEQNGGEYLVGEGVSSKQRRFENIVLEDLSCLTISTPKGCK